MPPSCFAAPALAWYRDPSWWTAGATVVLAIASIIAGALAAKAFAKQRDLLAIEQNRDIEREEGVKRADASRVSAWPLYKGPDDFDWVAVLRNPTNLPIYNVKLAWQCNFYLVAYPWGYEQEVGLIAPGDAPEEIPMGTSFAAIVDHLQKSAWNEEGGPSRLPVTIRLSFSDAAGGEWVRDWDGTLVPASEASSLNEVTRLPEGFLKGVRSSVIENKRSDRASRARATPSLPPSGAPMGTEGL